MATGDTTLDRLDRTITDAVALAEWLRGNERAERTIERISDRLADCLRGSGRILACGNGGSMCDAMHFAEELSGRFRKDRQPFAAQALSDPAYLSCVANDWGFDQVFSRGVVAWGRKDDVLLVFSTSGKSRNVILAAEAARALGMTVIGLLGRDGGPLKALCDIAAVVPGDTADRIQEVHIKIVHLVIEETERRVVPENYSVDPR